MMKGVSHVRSRRQVHVSRRGAYRNAVICDFRPDEEPEAEAAGNFPAIRETHHLRTVSLRVTGKLVQAKAVNQANRVVPAQRIIVADASNRGTGIDRACFLRV